jgi:polysaccharide biosynthesis protein PslH
VPEAVFHLIGASPGPKIQALAARPGIRISADLADIRPAVCAGSVYVCAIRHGTGLKSKMLEAMAMRLPIVGYPGSAVGLEGSTPDKHYEVAHDPAEFAQRVVALLHDPARAETMAHAGRELVERHYSWESRARAYEDLYERVIQERHQTRTRPVARMRPVAGVAP